MLVDVSVWVCVYNIYVCTRVCAMRAIMKEKFFTYREKKKKKNSKLLYGLMWKPKGMCYYAACNSLREFLYKLFCLCSRGWKKKMVKMCSSLIFFFFVEENNSSTFWFVQCINICLSMFLWPVIALGLFFCKLVTNSLAVWWTISCNSIKGNLVFMMGYFNFSCIRHVKGVVKICI